MRNSYNRAAKTSFGLSGACFLFVLAWVVGGIYLVMDGLIFAYHASIILFFVTLFLPPLPLMIGLVNVLLHVDLAQKLAQALGLS